MGSRILARCVQATATVIAAVALSGCMGGEIQQSLVETNATLALMQEDLAAMRKSTGLIAEMDAELERMEAELSDLRKTSNRIAQMDAEIEAGIERLDSVGTSLAEVDEELDSVAASLRDLDVHLASLRRSFQKLDRSVPFVDIADDAPVEDPDGR